MKKITTVGIDLAKNIFQLHAVDEYGKTVLKKRLSRGQLLPFVANLPACLIGMEACGGSNYWAREFVKLGHDVKLMAPQFVKPYVKSNKNDSADAEAICEAVTRPNMRFVPIKNIESQDMQSLHRIRQRLIKGKTALMNEIRGLIQEYGVIIPQGIMKLKKALNEIIEKDSALSNKMKSIVREVYQELLDIEEKIKFYDNEIEIVFSQNEACQRLSKIEGVGVITATAIFAAIGTGKNFENGRQFAAYLGLVPRQHSSGGKERLLGISKRGDGYLRSLLIHGARAVIQRTTDKSDKRSAWINKLKITRGHNKTCVALANKNARIIWALLAKDQEYKKAC